MQVDEKTGNEIHVSMEEVHAYGFATFGCDVKLKVTIPEIAGRRKASKTVYHHGCGTNSHMVWEHFDRLYCISVKERDDRRTRARTEFEKVGLSQRVEFVLVDKHPTNPEQGIYESHLICMQKGIQAGAKTIAIFEDDVAFDRFDPEDLRRCAEFLSYTPEWKMCHFGCLVKRSFRTECPSVRRIRYRALTHAYVIHRPFAEALSPKPWQGIPYDDFLKAFHEDVYVIHPTFGFQSDSPSDNDKWQGVESFRKLIGGLRRIQRMNEFYHCHRTLIIAAHVALALIALSRIL